MDEKFSRRPTAQDISWFLDLFRNKQIDLAPPYQRRSVWTTKDRQFFLDTIFKGYPSPAIFLHKTVSDAGQTTFHVVDGKQRLETILNFTSDKIRMSKDYGDIRLNGKKWSQLVGETSLRQDFWNYQLSVEFVSFAEVGVINEVFDRLNRNSRKLSRQELRHARFDGWFMSLVEAEAKKPEWKVLSVSTSAREKRMADSQSISELLLVILQGRIHGFDQDALDHMYAEYDDLSPESDEPASLGVFQSEDDFLAEVERVKQFIIAMEKAQGVVSRFAKNFTNFYTLWSLVALHLTVQSKADSSAIAAAYEGFMQNVVRVGAADDLEALLLSKDEPGLSGAVAYWRSTRGANTDLAQRTERLTHLLAAVKP